jgi:hypothetical protein
VAGWLLCAWARWVRKLVGIEDAKRAESVPTLSVVLELPCANAFWTTRDPSRAPAKLTRGRAALATRPLVRTEQSSGLKKRRGTVI